jgi:hypothetical protein
MRKKKRPHTDTTVPYIAADPQDIMTALLRTPPPPAGDKATRKLTKRQTERARKWKRELKKLKERLQKPRKKDRGGPRK